MQIQQVTLLITPKPPYCLPPWEMEFIFGGHFTNSVLKYTTVWYIIFLARLLVSFKQAGKAWNPKFRPDLSADYLA